jgi:hypothetical protein
MQGIDPQQQTHDPRTEPLPKPAQAALARLEHALRTQSGATR